jgi:hypothetical protein
MRIKRFNESSDPYEGMIVRVSRYDDNGIISTFDVKYSDIKHTEKYWRYTRTQNNPNDTEDEKERTSIHFGLEEFLEYQGIDDLEDYSYDLIDEDGNIIEDIGLYRMAKKYNL